MFGLPLLLVAIARAADPTCASPSVVAEELRNTLASGKNVEAVERVHAAEASFDCLTAYVSVEDLASMYQLAGTAAWYSPRKAEAAALYRRAAVVAPTVPFDGANLGAEAAQAYEAARTEVASGSVGTLVAVGPVVVDGTTIRTGSTVVVPAGVHLVQEGFDGRVRTTTLQVTDGARLEVGTLDPAVAAARAALARRKRLTAYSAAGALTTLAGGLYVAAVLQERSIGDVSPEVVDDPEGRARSLQLGANASLVGTGLALGGAVTFFAQGLALGSDPAASAATPAAEGARDIDTSPPSAAVSPASPAAPDGG